MTQRDEFNSLEGIYRSFKTTDDSSYDTIGKSINRNSSNDSEQVKKGLIRTIFSKIFPDTNGYFYPSETLWNQIYDLSLTADEQGNTVDEYDADDDAPEKISSLLRVYYYNQSSNNKLSGIKQFYKEHRPSAYKSPTVQKKPQSKEPYEVSDLKNLIEKTLSKSDIKTLPSSLMMVLVDSPSINFKLRNASKAELFLNYFSPISMSRAVPYLEAKFTSRREGKAIDNLYQMSPLRFLLGPEALKNPQTPAFAPGTANRLLYDSSKNVTKPFGQQDEKNSELQSRSYQTGMEMFTMPQTLVNLSYDQEKRPRYTPVINPTVPFGTIISFSINAETSHDAMSFKQATMILKIFDRSRLQEIADYLNPELYTSLEVSLIYGWVAPFQPSQNQSSEKQQIILRDEYSDFINRNMLVSELFCVGNSMISIDNTGAAIITLTLHTKGTGELRDVTPTGESIRFQSKQNDVRATVESIKRLGNQLGILQMLNDTPNLKVPSIINSATGGQVPELSNEEFQKQLKEIETLLSQKNFSTTELKAAAQKFIADVKNFYQLQGVPRDPKSKEKKVGQLEDAARKIYKSRFGNLDLRHDLFAYAVNTKNIDKFADDNEIAKNLQKNHPLNENKIKNLPEKYVSFGNLFATYFSTACAGLTTIESSSPIIDEYQVFFYNINDSAGPASNLNIAEFPIDVEYLEKEYARRIIETKGERMSLINFLEIVRTSQFADERHQAYGFRDFYETKDGELTTALKKGGDYEKAKLTANLAGSGERFKKPEIDFFIESGYSNESGTDKHQSLLQSYQISATSNTNNSAYNASEDVKRILRIHIYDKQSFPEPMAAKLIKNDAGIYQVTGKYKNNDEFTRDIANIVSERNEAESRKVQGNTQKQRQANQSKKNADIAAANNKLTEKQTGFAKLLSNGVPVSAGGFEYRYYTFVDENKKPRFELVKQAIASMVPTITIGTNGSMITSINYTTRQDENLNTIQIFRNFQNPDGVANGTSVGNLPLAVIPGQLSLTCLGCPVIEYMQQFFIDLGTGTTIDNLYNVIKIGHTLTPGKFTTDVTFGFADAYGSIDTAKGVVQEAEGLVKMIQEELKKSADEDAAREKARKRR